MWESLWQDIATYVNPRKDNILVYDTPGTKKFNDILDSTAINSSELLAAALHSFLTNPVGYFFGLTTGNIELDQRDPVRFWIQSVVRIIHDVLANTNFQTEVHEYFKDVVDFGIGTLLVEEDPDDIIRFSAKQIRECYLDQNSKNRIDTVYRCFKYKTRDIIDEFDKKLIPDDILKEYNEGKEKEYDIVHAVYPVRKGEKTRYKFHSKYVLKSKKVFLKESGFMENPFITGRWTKSPGEVYGRGCGERGLPETRLVNLMQETMIRSAQKTMDPPMQAPDDGFIFPLITRPGGVNFYRAGSQDRIEPIFNFSRIDYGFELTNAVQARIREAFYVDQLKLRDGPQMTATEVAERAEQGLRFLGPMMGRQESEFLQSLVIRLYGICERRGMFPDLPEELRNLKTPIKVKFTSVIAMTQRQSEITNIQRTMQNIAPFASADPSVLDVFDGTKAAKYVAKLCGFPQEIIRDEEQIAGIREERAQAEQQAREAEMQAMEADSASKIVGAAAKTQQAG